MSSKMKPVMAYRMTRHNKRKSNTAKEINTFFLNICSAGSHVVVIRFYFYLFKKQLVFCDNLL